MSSLLDNEWKRELQRDIEIVQYDQPTLDTRTFSRVTKSQLNSSKAIDKTLRHAHKHRSQCLPYSKASKAENPLGFNQVKRIKDETSLATNHILSMKFWHSFQKNAVSLSDENSSVSSCGSVPVQDLQKAIQSLTEREMSAEVDNIIKSLGFRATESLSWKEYKSVCFRLFGSEVGGGNSSNEVHDNLSQSQESYQSDEYSHSYNSLANSSSIDYRSDGLPPKAESYSQLKRKYRGVGSIKPNEAHLDVTDFSPSQSTLLAPVKKDALTEVLKNEYRKIRKNQLPESKKRLQDGLPRYLQDLQKNKIAAIRDKTTLNHKWKVVNEKRAARDARVENYKNRKDMIRAFKTVVNAQERNEINREVLQKDEESLIKVEDNAVKRYIENEITSHNFKSWHQNERKIRNEMRTEYKQKMKESVERSRQMIAEEKVFKKYILSEGNDSLSKTLSQCTSSMFEVPNEISDRIKNAKKLSVFEKAKEDAILAYENEMSRRISHYNVKRQMSIKQAEDFGCGISLNPLRGEDYFLEDGTLANYSYPKRISKSDVELSKYFDSASTVAYPGITRDSCYDSSCPPVYLDPNYPTTANKGSFENVSHLPYEDGLFDQAKYHPTDDTTVADGIHNGKMVHGEAIASQGEKHDNIFDVVGKTESRDDLSMTDSIDSNVDDCGPVENNI